MVLGNICLCSLVDRGRILATTRMFWQLASVSTVAFESSYVDTVEHDELDVSLVSEKWWSDIDSSHEEAIVFL